MSKLAKTILSISVVAFAAALAGFALYWWRNKPAISGSCDCDCEVDPV